MTIWIFSLSFSYCNYFLPFMVVPEGKKYKPADLLHNMASQVIWFGRCFLVKIVNFSLYLFPFDLQTFCFLAANCCMVDSSLNNTSLQCSVVQCWCALANAKRLAFTELVSNGFLAGFRHFNSKSYVNWRETVMSLTLTLFANNADCDFFVERVGDRTTIFFIKWSFFTVVFIDLSLLL